MVTQIWGDRKIPITVAVGILVLMIGLREWGDSHYMSVAQAQEADKKLSVMLVSHIDEYEKDKKIDAVRQVRKDILRVQDQQADLTLFETVNGESDLTRQRSTAFSNRLKDLEDIKKCLMAGGACE